MISMNNKLEQVGIRMVKERPLLSDTPISSPQDVVRLVAETFKDLDRELFAIVNFQSDLKPINLNIVSIGALNQSLVHPREVMKSAILSNASAVLLFHNHPSGSLIPSQEDIQITDRLLQAFSLMGIQVLDHIIIGDTQRYYSFEEKGILQIPIVHYKNRVDDLEFGVQRVADLERASILKQLNDCKKQEAVGTKNNKKQVRDERMW